MVDTTAPRSLMAVNINDNSSGDITAAELRAVLASICDVVDGITVGGSGTLTLQSYTVATLPAASSNTNTFIHVQDGNSGNPCIAYSDGVNWLRIVPGASVSPN